MTDALLASVRRAVDIEIAGLGALAEALAGDLGARVAAAAKLMLEAKARVILTGMGKSGHICRKIAATLASTGTPAYFVHPGEAGHGDLGMITRDDVILAASWSGESSELAAIIAYAGRFGVPLLAVTSDENSALGRAADICMALPAAEEACPLGLAPTTSTLMQLALGDALAIALLEGRGFTAQDFRVFHPGGKLGAKLRTVREIMHAGDRLPLVASGTTMHTAIVTMSAKGFGCVGVTDGDGRLIGIVTDGDLRRHLSDGLLGRPVDEVMTRRPKTTGPDVLLGRVIETLNVSAITALFVTTDEKPIGIVHVHDLLRAGVA